MPPRRVPSYRLHKASGQAIVTIAGRDHYLGKHGTEASRRAYDALVGRWIAGGRAAVEEPDRGATVVEVIEAFWTWAQGYYRKDGKPTSQISILRPALASLNQLYGDTPAAEFSPSRLKALRDSWVAEGASRSGANRRTSVVKQCFTWAVEHEMAPGSVSHALRAVRELSYGRTTAPERPKVLPVPRDQIDATMPFLKPREAALVRLQLASGMRPGEACIIRPADIDRSATVWAYKPGRHKTEHRGKDRIVFLGPEARLILEPWLAKAKHPGEYLFRGGGGTRWDPARPLRESTYYRAIEKACRKAGVEKWAPNRLRHNAGTNIRARYGIEASRILLGHSSAVTSEIYSEVDEKKAREIIEEVG